MPEGYTAGDHMLLHADLVTPEMLEKAKSVRRDNLLRRKNAPKLAKLATEFRVPNNEARKDQKTLHRFMEEIEYFIRRALALSGRSIGSGDKITLYGEQVTVLSISDRHFVTIKERAGRFSPEGISL